MELKDVHFSFDREVLAGITLEVRVGEVVALLGQNGAGKSTLLGIASGMLNPTSGSATLNGRSVSSFARREMAREVAIVSQSGEMRFPLTSLEYVLAGRYARVRALGFDSASDFDVAHESLRVTDASQFAERRFNELSSGERQRVVLARALAQEPKLLLLDEPTANVDIAHQVSLLGLLRRLTRSHQLGALLVTHEINLAADFADRVALIKSGRLLACGSPGEVMTAEMLSQCFETKLLVDKHPTTGNPRVSPMLESR